jgi:Fe-S-cluster containining protein
MQECNCFECISACTNDPGRLIPSDIKKIAAVLGCTPEQLIADYLVKIPLGDGKISALAPAKLKGKRYVAEPGTIAQDYYADQKGKCVFLDKENRCSIHSVKPFECGEYMGCKNTFLGKPYREREVEQYFAGKWKGFKGM